MGVWVMDDGWRAKIYGQREGWVNRWMEGWREYCMEGGLRLMDRWSGGGGRESGESLIKFLRQGK